MELTAAPKAGPPPTSRSPAARSTPPTGRRPLDTTCSERPARHRRQHPLGTTHSTPPAPPTRHRRHHPLDTVHNTHSAPPTRHHRIAARRRTSGPGGRSPGAGEPMSDLFRDHDVADRSDCAAIFAGPGSRRGASARFHTLVGDEAERRAPPARVSARNPDADERNPDATTRISTLLTAAGRCPDGPSAVTADRRARCLDSTLVMMRDGLTTSSGHGPRPVAAHDPGRTPVSWTRSERPPRTTPSRRWAATAVCSYGRGG